MSVEAESGNVARLEQVKRSQKHQRSYRVLALEFVYSSKSFGSTRKLFGSKGWGLFFLVTVINFSCFPDLEKTAIAKMEKLDGFFQDVFFVSSTVC